MNRLLVNQCRWNCLASMEAGRVTTVRVTREMKFPYAPVTSGKLSV